MDTFLCYITCAERRVLPAGLAVEVGYSYKEVRVWATPSCRGRCIRYTPSVALNYNADTCAFPSIILKATRMANGERRDSHVKCMTGLYSPNSNKRWAVLAP